jgi:hypothetical protein
MQFSVGVSCVQEYRWGGYSKAQAVNEVDAGRDRATEEGEEEKGEEEDEEGGGGGGGARGYSKQKQ